MARIAVAAGVAAGAAALVASASSGASGGSGERHAAHAASANRAPIASLRPRHASVYVGDKVLLDASHSRDPDGRIVSHLWDLDGDGVYERNSGDRARIRPAFQRSGKVRVGMIVVDDDGAYAVRHARIDVFFEPLEHGSGGAPHGHGGAGGSHGHARVRAATDRKAASPRVHAQATPAKAASPATVRAAAASSSSSVTIKNFAFAPKSISVSVGTTVTWTNQDSPQHSATADDGTFDTGLISKGSSKSFTFNKAGTFNYHCIPHNYMKATVTVTGSGGNSSSGSNFTSGDKGGSSGSSKKSSNLPFTGLEIAAMVLAGVALLGAGVALRSRLARG